MKYLLILFLLGLFGAAAPCLAVVKECPLDKMIEESKLIVVGTVVRIEDISKPESLEDKPFGRAVAKIEIEQIILGSYGEKQIDVTYKPRLSIDAGFEIGERCILFINHSNRIVRGYAGKIPVDGDMVEVRHILSEQKGQTLKDFVQKIKARE